MRRNYVVIGVCAYELVALGTGWVPTLTRISHTIRRHPAGVAVIAAVCGWLWHHLLIEANEPVRTACRQPQRECSCRPTWEAPSGIRR